MYIKAIAWLQEYTSVQKHMEDWGVTFKQIKNHLCFQMYLWYKHINTSIKHRLSEQLGKNVPLGVLPKWLSLYQVPIISPSCLTLCEPMDYIVHGILQATILAWVASRSLHQGTFPTQGSNPGLPHCRQILCQLSYQESPVICSVVFNSLQPHGL